MNQDLIKAKKIFQESSATCVLCRGKSRVESDLRGVAPLLDLLDTGMDFSGYSACDKVVGKATAFLYCLLEVKAVYTPVISQPALEVLRSHSIEVQYDLTVPAILNRRKDGFCPMETATRNIAEPEAALTAIRATLEKLS